MDASKLYEAVDDVVRRRRTEKVIGDVDNPLPLPPEVAARNNARLMEALKASGWAPFHFQRGVDDLVEPWRAHVLWQESACKLARSLRDDHGIKSKLPKLAAGCSAMVLMTWLPEFYDEAAREASNLSRDKQLMHDEEHLAAASAMVQTFLLLLTAHSMVNYWSSGGPLREPEMLDLLSVPRGERLLGVIFVEYPEMRKNFDDDPRDRRVSARRDRRSEDGWIREVTL
ncbi:MAG: nitroreductase [Acidobacteriota bacterium]